MTPTAKKSKFKAVTPSPKSDRELAKEAAKSLSQFRGNGKPVTLTFNGKLEVVVPVSIVKVIEQACRAELDEEMTTQQAADFLNVSRPYLIKLLDEGKIPYRLVGAHRRLTKEDVQMYDSKITREREKILDELVADAESLGLYERPAVRLKP